MDNYATHQRLLLRAALSTTGRILELGAGWYSTPLLHEVALAHRRPLVTHDNDPEWLEIMRKHFAHRHHKFGPLDRAEWAGEWGLAFIDHGPRPEEPRNNRGLLNALDRAQAVLDLKGRVDVFVLHDTEPSVRWEYDWDKVLGLFRYSHTDTTHDVHTTILSDGTDVRDWGR